MSVLVASSDFMLRTRIAETASGAGAEVETAQAATDFLEKLRQNRPRVVFLDLDSPPLQPLLTLRTLRNSGDLEGLAVIAFYQHTNEAARAEAESLEPTELLTRGQLVASLKDLIVKYA